MAERGHTSSMTSVTEYDSSIDSESDTTESTNSNVTSSLFSSTDTDDKLTPSLGEISISATAQSKGQTGTCKESNQTGIKRPQPSDIHGVVSPHEQLIFSQDCNSSNHHPFKRVALNRKHRPQDRILRSALGHWHHSRGNISNAAICSSENMGVDDLENKLSTDFSDTSSRAAPEHLSRNNLSSTASQEDDSSKEESNLNGEPDEEGSSAYSQSQSEVPSWEPDMCSSTWYQAGCFSRYWSHYGFVMAWYRAHMDAVRRLHRDMLGRHSGDQAWQHTTGQRGSNSVRHNRRARRARNRRSAKAKRKAAKASNNEREDVDKNDVVNDSANTDKVADIHEVEEEEEKVEMEITEDMMAFFTTSLKHRMERDNAKSDAAEEAACETRVNIEDATVGQAGPSTAPPQERPGARRAQEMKQLYGTGAPMIHGMETALQMTFDRIQDKFQPKLWPNMPLKIVFG